MSRLRPRPPLRGLTDDSGGLERVQVELGHADPAFTLRVYGHLWPDEIDSGPAQLDALLAGPHLAHAADTEAAKPLQ